MIKVNISSLLNNNKNDLDPLTVYGNEEIADFKNFTLPTGFDYDLLIWPGEDGVLLLTGTLEFDWSADCDFCLEKVSSRETVDLSTDIYPNDHNPLLDYLADEEFYRSEAAEAEIPIHDGRMLDLTKYLTDTVYLNLPLLVKCADDCPGLCSKCGRKNYPNHECVKSSDEDLQAIRPEFDKLHELL